MKYNLDKTSYKTFQTFSVGKLPYRAYFVPFGQQDKMLDSDPLFERYQSDKITLLNGEWDFAYFSNVSNLPSDFDTNNISFNKEINPFCWQRKGYEPPVYLNSRYPIKGTPPNFPTDCPVGVYRKLFDKSSVAKSEILTFLGIAGGGYNVYVNGQSIGYHEGSHNSGEWEIAHALKEGQNEIVVVLFKWTQATYIECQDMFRENGIFRDCFITTHNDSYIYDYYFSYTQQDRSYNCKLEYSLVGDKDSTVSIVIKDDDTVLYEQTSKDNQPFEFKLRKIQQWSAENPKLYTLYITVLQQDGEDTKEVEFIRQLIGFKTINIDGNVFKFNDKAIKLLGVNHHDSNCKTGYVMSVEDYLTHVKMMKDYNVNCVRTAHYPPDPILITMCDIYGLYCIDEADIEAHGAQMSLHRPNLISNNLKWKNHMLDRVKAMFMRDRNHPSITMWSLGNESGGIKCQVECYNYLKTVTDIPVHYEPAFRFPIKHFDVYSRMYHPINPMRKVANKTSKKELYRVPYFQCEFAHAMGVGPGGLDEYVKTFYMADHMLGGCIWEWIDHAVEHENGPYKYTYGGDHGEKMHDGNFCSDGLFFPDRTPSSGALCMKNSYRPIVATIQDNNIIFSNRRYWQDSSDLNVTVEVVCDGNVVESYNYDKNIAPQESKDFGVKLDQYYDNDCWVRIFYHNKDNFLVASESHEVYKRIPQAKSSKSIITQLDDNFVATNKDLSVIFDQQGDLLYYEYKGNVIVDTPIRLSYEIWRPYIDNYRNLRIVWQILGYHKAKFQPKKAFVLNDRLIVDGYMRLRIQKVKIRLIYSIEDNGQITITSTIKNNSIFPTDFSKMGVKFQIDKKYNNVKYYGLGDGENYSDFDQQSVIGVFEQTTKDFFQDYIKPQDNGNRSKVRWFEVTDNDGVGLKATALNDAFDFKADQINEQTVNDGKHIEDVKASDCTNIYVNGFVRGIGSQSCGFNDTEKKYRKYLTFRKSFTFSFVINPITTQEENQD